MLGSSRLFSLKIVNCLELLLLLVVGAAVMWDELRIKMSCWLLLSWRLEATAFVACLRSSTADCRRAAEWSATGSEMDGHTVMIRLYYQIDVSRATDAM